MSEKNSDKLSPTSKLETRQNRIFLRDINTYKSNSDPIPILLIFCFFMFLVFVFVLLLILLLLSFLDRSVEEPNSLTVQDFNFFVKSIEFFEEQNQENIALLHESYFSSPLSENFSFDFRDLSTFSSRHLAELTQTLSTMQNESKVSYFALEKSRDYEVNSLDELMLNISALIGRSNPSASLQLSTDRITNLQEFFQSARDRHESNISSEFTRFSSLENSPKPIAAKNLEEGDRIEIQLPKNIDEFSTHIAIANLSDSSSSWEKPAKKVPEPAGGLSAIVIFIFAIFLISRRKK